ncbi:MAG: hypothetical protein EB078_07965, partial [Proteobacteria bacterium]|nr:hypothetical protein [Pseudomonadota bacterium]
MKYLLRSFVFILFMGFSSHSFAERPATLPGGLVFPSFSTAALVNTAGDVTAKFEVDSYVRWRLL